MLGTELGVGDKELNETKTNKTKKKKTLPSKWALSVGATNWYTGTLVIVISCD